MAVASASHAGTIAVNSIGYLPDFPKSATAPNACNTFEVVDAFSGTTVHSNMASNVFDADPIASNTVAILEFSAFTTPGRYFLRTDAGDESPEFVIRDGVFNDTLKKLVIGMYLMRCGDAVYYDHNGEEFWYQACHLHDANMSKLSPEEGGGDYWTDRHGGWHDAGDYNKYTLNMAFSLGMMLQAWERNQTRIENMSIDAAGYTDPNVPDFLEECRWTAAWLLRMQRDDGSFHNIVAHTSHGGVLGAPAPDEDTVEPRYISPDASPATGYSTAALAMAARIFAPYDPDFSQACSNASLLGWTNWLATGRKDPVSAGIILRYNGDDLNNDRFHNSSGTWASAEVFETHGLSSAHDYFQANYGLNGKTSKYITWGTASKMIGYFTYINSGRPNNSTIVGKLVSNLQNKRRVPMSQTHDASPYDQLFTAYQWGYNAVAASGGIIFTAYNPNHVYANGLNGYEHAHKIADYMFGRNRYQRSFVTGLGHNPPVQPHDRRSTSDNNQQPWPFALVGGRWNTYVDSVHDYGKNEISINGMTTLIGSMAALYDPAVEENHPPVITSIPPGFTAADASYTYSIQATDANPGDSLTYRPVQLPVWAAFDAASHSITGTPTVADIGQHTVEIEVIDGFEATKQRFTVHVILDADGDGMEDTWESAHFGNNEFKDGTADSDGDGTSDYEEFIADTNPNDPAVRWRLYLDTTEKTHLLSWASATNRTYRVYRSNALEEEWELFRENIPAAPPENELPVSSFDKALFYRVEVE
jgi:endoglucanase